MRICKTPALGGKVIVCKNCHHHHYVYNSCGHSHCPICQSIKREQWIDKLKNELFNIPYVHVIFTLPHKLNGLARNNKKEIYSLLMKSAWNTIKTVSADPNNIGGLPGMIAVLHTFGSDLKYHIHVHCLVTFGAIDSQNHFCIPKRKNKIARYRQINKIYKETFIEGLKKLYEKDLINYRFSYDEVMELIGQKSWVVHNTKPTIDTTILENYLSRYINRVAISNNRVEYIKSQSKVNLIYNDYRNQEKGKPPPKQSRELKPLVFINQFLQHVLPPYFQKSRRYGLHASATKKKYKEILPDAIKRNGHIIRTLFEIITQLIKQNPFQCEKCGSQLYHIFHLKADKTYKENFIKIPINIRPPPVTKIIL